MNNSSSFNRTILELKCRIPEHSSGEQHSFNRTILELKLLMDEDEFIKMQTFNRTILELKFHNNGCERSSASF